MTRIKVIGIGSPFADDQAGWQVAETLLTSKEIMAYGDRLKISLCCTPAVELLTMLTNVDIAIVVDAVRFSGAPGTLYRMGDLKTLFWDGKALSSHGVDMRTIFTLADTLDEGPGMTIFYGIEGGPDIEPGSVMSESARLSVGRVVDEILRDVANYYNQD